MVSVADMAYTCGDGEFWHPRTKTTVKFHECCHDTAEHNDIKWWGWNDEQAG